ncbi:MAG: NADH-quinone oxidoreductase subunit M [Verrucomicrobia bacterium]|nr:NADH-quinone oxidoreductase subunit M [Verrucomicrobiota bacterium]
MTNLLSAIFLVPLLAAALVLFIPRPYRFLIRLVALAATLGSMALAFALFLKFDSAPAVDGFKFNVQHPWAPSLGISYHVGVDGLNLGLIVMGAIVAFAAACASHEIKSREKDYYVLLLLMSGGILGAFASLDLFFLYFFHELALVPTFIMIGVWGRGEERNYATFKMTLYLSLGALIALAGLIALYFESGAKTFDIVALTRHVQDNPRMLPAGAQGYIFPLLLFGFGILVSLWPFHTWAPLGYGAAPTATAMLHAGVLKKFGLYGLIRVALPLLPEGSQAWLHLLAWLCLGNIVYCGLVAARQRDLNLLIGNSSVAHMGFVFLGIASLNLIGITGAVVVMVAHGLLAALTFGLAGYLRQQTGTVDMDRLGGLMRPMPFIGSAFVMAALAGCGLPGFGNFAGEIMVLFGAWRPFGLVTVFAAWGALVIGAVYMLRAVRNILHGPLESHLPAVADASAWRKVPFVLLLAVLLALGIWPRLLVDKVQPAVEPIVKLANGPEFKRSAQAAGKQAELREAPRSQ